MKSLQEWLKEVKKLKKSVQQLTSKEASVRQEAWALGVGSSIARYFKFIATLIVNCQLELVLIGRYSSLFFAR